MNEYIHRFLSELTASDIINICLCILSFLLAAISVVTVVITLRQNCKMIEGATRPMISVYIESVIIDVPMLYLVVKNFGNSTAYMEKFSCDFDLTGCYKVNNKINYINDFSRCNFAPGQSRICLLDPKKIDRPLHFSIGYFSGTKHYKDHIEIDISSSYGFPEMRGNDTKGKSLSVIAQALQEILFKDL